MNAEQTDSPKAPASPELLRAIDFVSAAYTEAMRRHGLIPGAIRNIAHEANLIVFRTLTASPDEGGSTIEEEGDA